jgi:hypothetical protein
MYPPSLTEGLLKALLEQLLLALDFLHSEAEVIHTGKFLLLSITPKTSRGFEVLILYVICVDIQAKNIMIGTSDSSIFTNWDKLEQEKP